MELETWYKAEDQYERNNAYYYNYFIDLGDNKIGYYSITFHHPDFEYDFAYVEDDYDTVKEDILDNFEFEEISEQKIIEDCFR